ncbi:Holliday junction DNA helicase RuvA [Chloroherpeton thalassium ATCC 35110]|uniref:Holliday junction branch migration complex subunit RuvA n=1 Tax=Chloroherpeton thalassium (strain ATCC 35110 / GB-78) TaxID=517418 RepID=RUVA_CHLT3|nr:Holliday junction branch migration protein RuvA [Chloroherpeton thalassium]B3QVA9.1 RecName: Full=Holliday junction branch migration complex subunit RuvA [Chloroherpeton thalassium ATCC 35110]ACF13063.1 Holliday junction DNA helicase RuvA [Chloroherpeton thalassium ATCC 35110]
MLSYLSGTLIEKFSTEIVVEVNGVGYLLNISATTHEKLPAIGNQIKILTYLYVREDALQLYGFITTEDREVFKLLIAISGVGPKLAQTILSGMSTAQLRESVIAGDTKALTAIAGVGKKTAERIILELKDKLVKLDLKIDIKETAFRSDKQQVRNDAYSALISLGFTKSIAEKAMRAAIAEVPDGSVDDLIRVALRHVQS